METIKLGILDVYTTGDVTEYKIATIIYHYGNDGGINRHMKLVTDENGRVIQGGSLGYIEDKNQMENVTIELFESENKRNLHRWCKEWHKLNNKKQLIIFSVYGKDKLRDALKFDVDAVGDPTILYRNALNYWYTNLDHNESCNRCGGSGGYSYNPSDGYKCFKCNGKGITGVIPKVKDVRAVIADNPDGLKDVNQGASTPNI